VRHPIPVYGHYARSMMREASKGTTRAYPCRPEVVMEPLMVALLQAAAADPVGDLLLNYGGNAAARRGLGRLDT
jgi:hypothetical protein